MAVGSGVAGVYITHNEPSGGTATVFFGLLSFATLVAATVSIMLGEGVGEMDERGGEGGMYTFLLIASNGTRLFIVEKM